VEIAPYPVAIARLADGGVCVTAACAIAPFKMLSCMPTHRLFLKKCKSAPWTSRKCVASLCCNAPTAESSERAHARTRLVNACILTFLRGVARIAVSIRDNQPGELICVYCDDGRA